MERKVKLILVPMGLAVFGIWCFQKCWVLPFINKKLPCSNTILFLASFIVLCLSWKTRSEPKLNEAIIGLTPNSFSLSACQPLLSFPSRYWLSKTVVKLVLITSKDIVVMYLRLYYWLPRNMVRPVDSLRLWLRIILKVPLLWIILRVLMVFTMYITIYTLNIKQFGLRPVSVTRLVLSVRFYIVSICSWKMNPFPKRPTSLRIRSSNKCISTSSSNIKTLPLGGFLFGLYIYILWRLG